MKDLLEFIVPTRIRKIGGKKYKVTTLPLRFDGIRYTGHAIWEPVK